MLSLGLPLADWQTWVTLLIVAAAAAWLIRRVARTVSKAFGSDSGPISGCGHCPRNPASPAHRDVVPLESIGTKRKST